MTLSLQHVGKTVAAEMHIDDVSLDLEPGSLTVLLGLTLSGKTTLMRLMAGLDKPTTGSVLADGRDTARIPVRKRNVAMVYQQFVNYPSLTVYENIASPLRLARVPAAEIDRRVRTEAERLQIDGFLDRMPAELSGGQQQRTAMARALVRDASLILLDEPLVNLDYKLREALREDLPRIFKGRQSTVVYATTDPWEALALGGRTVVLQEGRLVQSGPAPEVYAAPATTHVASVFSDPPMNIFTAEMDAGQVQIADRMSIDDGVEDDDRCAHWTEAPRDVAPRFQRGSVEEENRCPRTSGPRAPPSFPLWANICSWPSCLGVVKARSHMRNRSKLTHMSRCLLLFLSNYNNFKFDQCGYCMLSPYRACAHLVK